MTAITHGHLQGPTFKVGDYVTPNPNAGYPAHVLGVVYKVAKEPVGRNGVNYLCERADGVEGRGLRGPASALLPADPEAPRKSAYEVLIEQAAKSLPSGTIVTVNGRRFAPRALYVVTGETARGARLSRLGGSDGTRYWTGISWDLLTEVPLTAVGEYL